MNDLPPEKWKRLREALKGGASLRDAAAYARCAKNTALRHRLGWDIPANTQNGNRKRWRPSGQQRVSPEQT